MSTATQDFAATGVRWDLSALFSGLDDPAIGKTWDDCKSRADRFAEHYRGKVASQALSPSELAAAIRELEDLSNEVGKPMEFAQLLFAANSADPEIGGFLQRQMEMGSDIRIKVVFFQLELQGADEAYIASALADPALANYKHFIEVTRLSSPHRLSEPEEVLLEETANTGCRAWVRLHEEVTTAQVYNYRDPASGETSELSQEEILNRLRHPDRAVRLAAADAFSGGLRQMERTLCFIYNTLLADKRLEDRLRSHPYPEHSRHLANELDKETVDLVTGLCRDRSDIVERYYSIKREILGLPELTHVDRYAPLFETQQHVSWDDGRDLVLDAFGRFSPIVQERAKEFFDRSWIDAEPRTGKVGGAFCSPGSPDLHPVLFLTYLGDLNDVMTLAHELGHGVHASLSRVQTPFNFNGTLPLAELASISAEMVVFDRLVEQASPKDKLALYAEKIEGMFATVHRQAAMFRFEQKCHLHRREKGELSPDQFGQYWQDEMQSMFRDAVRLGSQHSSWWMYVSHFFFAPFYVYAYAFGELLALAVFERSKTQGPEFVEKYIEVLRLGGARSPHELMEIIGVDLHSREFWEGGLRSIERMVDTFADLWADQKAS